MQFNEIHGNNIRVFPEVEKDNHKIIIEFTRVKPFNKFMNQMGDLTGHNGFKLSISNQKQVRTLVISEMKVQDFLNFYEYFVYETAEVV